jgi:hypothetical protein
MTPIPAIVVDVDRLGDEYFITVRADCERYAGPFGRLSFGDNTPRRGSYRHGWLDLVYYQNFGLKAGEPFPLWLIR